MKIKESYFLKDDGGRVYGEMKWMICGECSGGGFWLHQEEISRNF